MKRIAILIPALLLSFDALAIERYQSDTMSCASVAAAVDRDGTAILRYRAPNNPSLQLYDRYVRDDRFCSRTQRARAVSVPARDTANCRVRKCVRVSGAGNR